MATYFIFSLISTILLFGSLLSAQTGPGNPLSSNIVSFQELRHKVPGAAQSEMNKACKARLKHKDDDEILHLRNAVRIDPEYVAARNNLAISLVGKDPVSAVAQLEQAIKIDPHRVVLFHNLALAYLVGDNLEAAERAARHAIDLDATATRTRVLLGILLVLQHKHNAEALADLEPGREIYPPAGMFSAEVLLHQKRWSKAKTYIDEYLSSGDDRFRDTAERWLRYIDQRVATGEAALTGPALPAPE